MNPKKSSTARDRRPRPLADEAAVTLARHRAQCRICRHPRREEIEWEFLDWVPGREIAETYKLGSSRAVYRHAHAHDLLRRRRGYVQRGSAERAGGEPQADGAGGGGLDEIAAVWHGGRSAGRGWEGRWRGQPALNPSVHRPHSADPVSYTPLRAHETREGLVIRLLL